MSISDEAIFSDLEQELVNKVLSKGEISLDDFKIKARTGNFFKSHARKLLLIPKDFTISDPEIDELNKDVLWDEFKDSSEKRINCEKTFRRKPLRIRTYRLCRLWTVNGCSDCYECCR